MAQIAAQYNCNYDGTMNFTGGAVQLRLSANTEVTFTVPGPATTMYAVDFRYNSNNDYFIGYKVTAVIPAPDVAGEVGNLDYKPDKRFVFGGDVLHFITPNTTAYMGFTYRVVGN